MESGAREIDGATRKKTSSLKAPSFQRGEQRQNQNPQEDTEEEIKPTLMIADGHQSSGGAGGQLSLYHCL